MRDHFRAGDIDLECLRKFELLSKFLETCEEVMSLEAARRKIVGRSKLPETPTTRMLRLEIGTKKIDRARLFDLIEFGPGFPEVVKKSKAFQKIEADIIAKRTEQSI